MTTGSEITASGLKTIQDKAELLLGLGTGTRGYGQTVLSQDYAAGFDIIRKAHWDALRYDIVNIRTHQDGSPPPIVSVNVGDVISYGAESPNSSYDAFLETAIANRFNVGPGRAIVNTIGTATYSSSWSNKAQCTLTITFTDSDHARHFFNSGGKIQIRTEKSKVSVTPQNNAWYDLLQLAGTKAFGAITESGVSFYTLTNSFQTLYQVSSSTPYSANNYHIEVRCNISDNSNGGASIVYIQVTLTDAYVDNQPSPPDDLVDGTLDMTFIEVKADGPLVPTGNFTINSPSYSISSITAS